VYLTECLAGKKTLREWLKSTKFYQKHKYRLIRANDILSLFSAICLILFLFGDQSRQDLSRRAMISELQMTAFVTGLHTGMYKIDTKVYRSMAKVPRELFLNWRFKRYAYYNVALPLDGKDYMIPEPFISAMMIHLMQIQPGDKVMELGYGTGYEAAIMSHLAGEVYSIRQEAPLNQRLNSYVPVERHGYKNVLTKSANSPKDWQENGPFDAILVKQSMRYPPKILFDLLKPSGRLVIPVGEAGENQRLTVFYKDLDGRVFTAKSLYVKITPLLLGNEI
jgi:protein-L-isoaspartate(D-aspartate) O-methyltransferase